MENLPGNLQKFVKSLSLPKQSKRARAGSWILLAIEERGKIISIGRLKGLIIALVLTLVIVVVSVSSLLIIAKSASEENEGLRNALDASKKQVAALRDEKELLMVRLVLAGAGVEAEAGVEAGVEDKLADIGEKQKKETSGRLPDKSASIKTKPDPTDADKTVLLTGEKQPEEETASAIPAKLSSVLIEDFVVLFEPGSNVLKVQFKIIKISSDSQPVSGHAFVILKNDEVDEDRWLIFPRVTLSSGKPSQYNKGQYFSIYRFKTVNFKARYEADPKRFNNANVLVYNTTGDLLLEKSYPVTIANMAEDTLGLES
ncbi:MAG: hypothetical protein U9R02_03775 [Thermodesulfobacteriota bacterium]|nr:hypothetical protein [Thermodesulfobacteriota bacterium]